MASFPGGKPTWLETFPRPHPSCSIWPTENGPCPSPCLLIVAVSVSCIGGWSRTSSPSDLARQASGVCLASPTPGFHVGLSRGPPSRDTPVSGVTMAQTSVAQQASGRRGEVTACPCAWCSPSSPRQPRPGVGALRPSPSRKQVRAEVLTTLALRKVSPSASTGQASSVPSQIGVHQGDGLQTLGCDYLLKESGGMMWPFNHLKAFQMFSI